MRCTVFSLHHARCYLVLVLVCYPNVSGLDWGPSYIVALEGLSYDSHYK